jgi:hypothetical protein
MHWVLGEPAASVVVRSTEKDSNNPQINDEMRLVIKTRDVLKPYTESSN